MPRPSRIRLIIEYDYNGERYHSVTENPTQNGPDVVVFNAALKAKIAECIGANSHNKVPGDHWSGAKLGPPKKGPYQGGPEAELTRGGGGEEGGPPPDGEICWHDPLCDWFCVE